MDVRMVQRAVQGFSSPSFCLPVLSIIKRCVQIIYYTYTCLLLPGLSISEVSKVLLSSGCTFGIISS